MKLYFGLLMIVSAAAELQLLGLFPNHGRRAGGETITVALAGVEQSDWDGFDSNYFLTWPTGESTGFYQVSVPGSSK